MSKILIVDDEPETLNVLSTFLEITGHTPIATYDPQYAIMLAEKEHPDCALLDIMMPQMDGFSLCRLMRDNPLTKALPIMFITAYSPLDLEDRRRDAGADMVLMKPFGLDALTQCIEKVISSRPKVTSMAAASDASTLVFRRDANTALFSSKLCEFLDSMDFK